MKCKMVERPEDVSISSKQYREYIEAENKAYEAIVKAGYAPQGYNFKTKKVVVYKIENRNTNDEHIEYYSFENWQKAKAELC